jgi:hypothetical protein
MYRIIIMLCFLVWVKPAFTQSAAESYIDAFSSIAISEMQRTGIPASIKLAQALLESNYGRSEMSLKANNHFGIKCGSNWSGSSYYKEDDDKDHRGKLVESCFRVYANAERSFIAHSDFLLNDGKDSRYNFLFDYHSNDYQKWAFGLKKAGYATDPKYPQKLINLIEKYELYRYDDLGHSRSNDLAFESTNQKMSPKKGGRILNDRNVKVNASSKRIPNYKMHNNVKMVLSSGSESLHDIATQSELAVGDLMAFNEEVKSAYDVLSPKTRIYLEPKQKAFSGNKKFHQVREGEKMKHISQQYAVDLEALYLRNRMPIGSEPMPGEKIQLKGLFRTGKKPALLSKNKSNIAEKSRFVEQTVEYIFSPKHAEK